MNESLTTIEIKEDPENFITTIILNRPAHGTDPRINTINSDMLNDLDKAVDLLHDDPKTRVIVIRGAKKYFSGGADLTQGLQEVNSPWTMKKFVVKGQRVFKRFRDLPKAVIAAIEGYAIGGGLELAMNCDLRFAKKGAVIGNPEVRIGLIPGWGGTQLMLRHIGVSKTMELLLTGELIKVEEAQKIGLINRVIERDKFEDEVYKIAKDIAQNCSPIAVGVTKQMVNFGGTVPLDVGLEMESYGSGMIYSTKDLIEGITSYLQQKRPKYKAK